MTPSLTRFKNSIAGFDIIIIVVVLIIVVVVVIIIVVIIIVVIFIDFIITINLPWT